MPTKTVCFDCRSYSTIDRVTACCYHCVGTNVANTGSAFRLPRKTQVSQWRKLNAIFQIQKAKQLAADPTLTNFDLVGFGQHNFRRRSEGKTGLPTKTKDAAHLKQLMDR